MNGYALVTIGALLLLVAAPPSYGQAPDETCLLDALADAEDSMTVGELRFLCQESPAQATADRSEVPVFEQSIIEERIAAERAVERRPFIITAHQPNYLMWSIMDEPNQAPFAGLTPNPSPVDDNEMVFQVSFKAPFWRNILGSNLDGYFAYTAKSWWQLFADDISAPFRETNYQPEFFVRSVTSRNFLGMRVAGWDLGINHESNGRSDPLSRSWNRVMGRTALQVTDDLNILLRAWYRIPADEGDDDNPGEYRYYGYGDVRAIWTPNRNTFTAMVRPGTEETGYELTWSYPIGSVFRVYLQYYKGFGESLLDYDYDHERIGVGIAMNDFLGRN